MADTALLLRAMLDLSPGDRSMLEVACSDKHTDNFHLTTTQGSPNFRLWTQMAEQGWMVRLPDPAMPEGVTPVAAAQFQMTDAGKTAMAGFLSDFATYDKDHAAKMTEIFNGTCIAFAKTFAEKMRNAGATEKDYVLLTAFTVARLVSDVFRPQAQDKIAGYVLEQAKKRMADLAARKPD